MKSQVFGVLLLLGWPAVPLMAQQGAAAPVEQAATQAQPMEAAQATPQVGTAGAAKTDQKICKRVAVTGSRFKSRLCHTQHEWDAIDRAHKDKMREIDSQPIHQRAEGG